MKNYYIQSLLLVDSDPGASSYDVESEVWRPVYAAQRILDDYNFIGVTERMDESLVVLKLLLNLELGDILYLSAKQNGSYDAGGGFKNKKGCVLIQPSVVSPGMEKFLYDHNSKWQSDIVKWDKMLYQAVNQSLDLTIDRLGRPMFEETLSAFRSARDVAIRECRDVAVPCSLRPVAENGTEVVERLPEEMTSCLWKDSGCGATCLDKVADRMFG